MIKKNYLKGIAKTIAALHFLLVALISYSADLPRQVILGIRMEPVSENLNSFHHYPENFGVFVTEVIPGGTFYKIGIPDSVIIQQINKDIIQSTSDVLSSIGKLSEGDSIQVMIYQNGSSRLYSGTCAGKPKETHPAAAVKYGSVSYPGNQLRSLLYLPHGVENPPVVFFIQGYTCQSVEVPDWNPVKKLINNWIEAGFAVYMVEKPGMGDSQSDIPCMEIDFNQEVEAFSQAYSSLRNNTDIDQNNIFLFGHSMGGVIAPIIAKEHQPQGLMVFGIVGKNWHDYMLDIFTEQRKLMGMSDEEVEAALEMDAPFITDMLINKKPVDELINNPVYGNHLRETGTALNLQQGYYLQRHYTFWQTLAEVNIPEAWRKVDAPVHVIHGEYDIQAINPRYGKMIADNVNSHGGKAEFTLVPQTEHAFLHFDSMEQNLQSRADGSYSNALANNYNPEVAQISIGWMKGLLVNR